MSEPIVSETVITETILETEVRRTPIHLWIIGVLAVLWNGFGAYDYFMTRTKGAAYIETMMPGTDGEAMMAYINAFPLWASAGWGLGVWGGLLGSILLLMRHRWAVPVFGVSLVGALSGLGYQMVDRGPAEMHQGANAVMPYVIIFVALALFAYARSMARRGVLR